MSTTYSTDGVLTLKLLCKIAYSSQCSKATEFNFIKDSLTKDNVPDYNGDAVYKQELMGNQCNQKITFCASPMPSSISIMLDMVFVMSTPSRNYHKKL